MKKEVGLWIDHRETFIVSLQNGREETRQLTSDIEKKVRFSTGSHSDPATGIEGSTAEDMRDRQFVNQLNIYYDSIIALIRDAEAIWIFGPGEAKVELGNRLRDADLGAILAGIETTDKMTIPQIIAKVNLLFGKERREGRTYA